MTTLLTPLDNTEAEYIELGEKDGVFWKQIIPMNHTIDYNGRKITFDKAKLDSVKEAFAAQINDQTAFQLANDDNEHDTEEDKAAGRHFDPKRYRGEVTQFAVNNRGLYGKFNLTAEGAKLIQANPKLSVSASLKENVEHNGKIYPMVCRHVLGTLDARIKGMSPWSKDDIGLTNDDNNEEVLDLTMPETDEKETVTVPKEDWDKVMSYVNSQSEEDAALEALLAEDNDDDDSDDSSTVDNSQKRDPKLIQLSNDYAAEKFERKADAWRREGVPNKMIELSKPALSAGDELTINLSNGNSLDAKAVISAILDEAKGTIDMSEQTTTRRNKQEDDDEEQSQKDIADYFNTF